MFMGLKFIDWKSVLVLLGVASLLTSGCAGVGTDHKYQRLGAICVASNNIATVSNALVHWSGTLTNGYSLQSNEEIRRAYIESLFKDDPNILFMLENRKNPTAPWGVSACSKNDCGLYYATIIIRLQECDE